jgi:hypothetical protein
MQVPANVQAKVRRHQRTAALFLRPQGQPASVGWRTCGATTSAWPNASGKSATASDAGPPLDAVDLDPDLPFLDDDLAA